MLRSFINLAAQSSVGPEDAKWGSAYLCRCAVFNEKEMSPWRDKKTDKNIDENIGDIHQLVMGHTKLVYLVTGSPCPAMRSGIKPLNNPERVSLLR